MRSGTFILSLVVALLAPTALATQWKSLPSAGKHLVREETSMTSCGGTNICLIGGRNRVQTPVLDTATLKWKNGRAPPIELHHFQAVTGPDGCAWIIGAWTGKFPGEKAVKEIYRYCASKNEWEVVGTIDRPRGAGGVAYYGGYFYLVTGNVGGHRVSAETKVWFDRYDPKTKTWKTMPDIPHPRDHVNVVVVGSKMYVAGGRDSGAANYPDFFLLVEKNVDVFDFNTNTWSTLAQDFPRPRAGASAVLYKGQPLIAGGEGSGRAWVEVDVLSGGRFVPFADMPRPRHGFGMYACNDVIWVAGGAGVQGGGTSQTDLDAYFSGAKPVPCTFTAPAPTPTPTPTAKATTTPTSSDNPSTSATDAPVVGGSPNDGADVAGKEPGTDVPPPTEEEPEDCFPGHAMVHLSDGSSKFMKDLQIGDRVLVSHPDQFSEVYFFSHQHPEHLSEFVHLRTSVDNIALQLSARHILYANGKLTEARHVRIGDEVSIAHEQRTATVTAVSRTTAKGLFNPHTLHGDIVVNRVATSTLTGALHPRVANVLLSPFNAFYRVFGRHRAVHAVNRGVLRALDNLYW